MKNGSERRQLGVVMDPIATISPRKDSTLAMLLAAQARGFALWYFELGDLFLRDGRAWGRGRALSVRDDVRDWFALGAVQERPLAALDVLLMRKDPPVDNEFFAATYLLEQAQAEGLLVVNDPRGLRDLNEKLATAWVPQCCPPTLVTRDAQRVRAFLEAEGDIVLKPLFAMGGAQVFRLRRGDPNLGVILETVLDHGRRFAMAQRFLPEIAAGDKRILMIDGEPIPYVLARIPPPGETRGNLAVGGRGEGRPLSARDRWICEQVAPLLRRHGILFAGLDVIGDHLTEINVTSPTGIRELDAAFGLHIGDKVLEAIEKRLGC